MITANQTFRLYELFFPIIKSEEKTKEIIQNIESVIDNKFSSEKDRLATKEDLAKELGTIRKEIAESKADIIKWMFLFWIGQIAVTIGIIFLKK